MPVRWTYKIPIIALLLLLSGCTILRPRQGKEIEIVDPLVERHEQWEKSRLTEGIGHFKTAILRGQSRHIKRRLRLNRGQAKYSAKSARFTFNSSTMKKLQPPSSAYLKLEPRDTDVRNYLGYTYEKLNDYDSAAQEYESTLEYSSADLYALNHLGLAYKQTGRLDAAEHTLRRVLEVDPKCQRNESKNLHNYLGAIHLEREEIGDAIAEFRESARLFPNDVWPRQQLAALYESQGRYYQAQLQYQEILAIDPDNLLAPTRLQALSKVDTSAPISQDVPPVQIVDIDSESIIAEASKLNDYPNADVIILMNQFSHDISSTGQSRYTTHQIVKLLTRRGIEQYDDIAIPLPTECTAA